jgi:tetraacyldisaccharide 4'-kinase
MEILDRRPWPERWLAGRTGAAPASPLAGAWSRLVDAWTARRVRRRIPPPEDLLLVAVGNLRVGGTGKTPVVGALAAALAERGIAGAVLTRGHGGAGGGPRRVTVDDPAAGDEARLLAGWLAATGWPVVQSPDRPAGLAWLRDRVPQARVVVLEDAYQTAGIGRHLDVLILDAWEQDRRGAVVPRAGATLPLGPYRESAVGAGRADVWLLETRAPLQAPAGGPAVCAFARQDVLAPVAERPTPAAGRPVALISGVARPERFEAAAVACADAPAVLAVRLRDHARYRSGDLEPWLARARARGAAGWLTTEKDWVKLQGIWPAGVPVAVVRQRVLWRQTPTLPDLVGERLAVLGAGARRG